MIKPYRLSFGAAFAATSIMAGVLMLGATPGFAQTAGQMDRLEQQIRDLQQQLQQMREQVNTTQQQVQRSQEEVKKVQTDAASAPKVTFTNGRPGWVSPDGQSSMQLTGRLHFDIADYMSVSGSRNSLQSGLNARRARLGVLGTVAGDWSYALIADFGGTSDATSASTSIIENAYISYSGFQPFIVDLGYVELPWTLAEATSSNDLMFLERASSQVVATAFGGGDARSAFGVRGNGDRWWAGAYLTGPAAGATHSGSSSQFAELARFTYNVYDGPDNGTVHLGINGANLSHGPGHTLTLSDRPELRVDPTTFLSTGAMTIDSGQVLGLEGAVTYDNIYVDGEFFHYSVDRTAGSSVDFNGGYIQASYTFGGRRSYSKTAGAYTGVKPDHPLDSSFVSWGAFEFAGRYSTVDLNDASVVGGKQNTYSLGLNWYPNTTIRFMLDYLHADIDDKPGSNLHMDAIAARAQFAF